MQVYALIGPSGTGKSYRAIKVAYENDIEYIIDDGILIHKNKILGGRSAKQADTKMEAVRRAIFDNEQHREEVKDIIKLQDIKKILLIGTSKKMVNQIANRLELGPINIEISIYDIATIQEIEGAKKSRLEEGSHIIPVPTLEVKKRFFGITTNPIKLFLKNKNNQQTSEVEKTVVRPTFSYMGKYYITSSAIKQIVSFEISKYENISKINNININNIKQNMEISVNIDIKSCNIVEICESLQKSVYNILSQMTLMNVTKIDIYLNKLR